MNKETSNTEKKTNKKFSLNKKKFKYGSIATAITVVFIAAIVFVNLIAGILTDRKSLKIDLTEEQYYEVSEDTIEYLKTITDDIEIAVMGDEASFETTQYTKMIAETLDKYKQNSEHIEVNFYDIKKNPDVVSKYSQNYNGTISEGSIVITNGDRVKVTNINNLFTFETDSYTGSSSITAFNGEQELTSTIMSVTDANPQTVAFINTYNEDLIFNPMNIYSVSALYSALEKNGYEIVDVDIISDELSPEDYDMVILPAPATDLSEDCITKLDDFLYNNGELNKNMVYIADVYQSATPNLDAFLEVWGIEIGDAAVYENDESLTQNAQIKLYDEMYQTGVPYTCASPIVTIADATYSEGLSNTKLPVIAPQARPINLLFDANVDRTTSALLTTSETAYLYPIDYSASEDSTTDEALSTEASEEETEETEATEATEATEFDVESAETGVQNVMAMATKFNYDAENNEHTNNLLVIGSTSMVDQLVMSSDSYNNAEFVVNTINKMCGKENGIIIAEKELSVDYIDITAAQAKTINIVVIEVIPIAVIVAGVVVFIRRRNR